MLNNTIARAALVLGFAFLVACGSGLNDVECTDNSDCARGICAAGQCIDLGDSGADAAPSDSGSTADTGADTEADAAVDTGVDTDAALDAVSDTGSDTGSDTDAADVGQDTPVDADAAAPDADVGSDAGEPNLCGGFGPLTWDGVEAGPGDACGACGDGLLVCNGGVALRCTRATEPNECGGCGTLAGEPGTVCGACGGGQWACAEGNVVCSNATPRNACGGCAVLMGTPGALCDDESGARWACDGNDIVVCGGGNACGGTEELTWGELLALPGDACTDVCGDGQLVCDGTDALLCLTETEPNECGGCGELDGRPETSCGDCGGAWTCDDDGTTFCDEPPANACGGCATLEAAPGTACDDVGGTWRCDGTESVACVGGGTNACGGSAVLSDEPGAQCGPCDNGVFECDGRDAVACSVDDDEGLNRCEGCATLPAPPGTPCGTCATGVWTCDGTDALTCEGDGGDAVLNACGGCRPLDEEPGTACGVCGELTCAGANALICTVPDGSTCDPCEELGCDEQFRECELIDELTGRCGACIDGYIAGSMGCRPVVTCDALACEEEGRFCDVPADGGDASCGECLDSHREIDGECVPAECTSDAACGAPVVEPGECVFDSPCTLDGRRTDTVFDPVCAGGFCETETSTLDVPCSRSSTEGNSCVSDAGNDGTCSDQRCIETVGPPTNVQASDGTSAARVEVSWNAVSGSSGYLVFRDGEMVGETTSATTTSFLDTTAEPGTPPSIDSADASNGTLTDRVAITWNVAPGEVGTRHSYTVAAIGPAGPSAPSAPDSGFRSAPELTGFELTHGDTTEWLTVGSSRRSYDDMSAPAGTINPGTAVASDGTFDAYVALDLSRYSSSPGPERAYQIRVVADGIAGPAFGPFVGFRGVGELGFRWFRARGAGSGFDVVNTTLLADPAFQDNNAPADGTRREFFCRVSADGAEDADSDTDLGNRARCECGSGQVWCAPGAGTCSSPRGCCAPELLGCSLSGLNICSP